MGEPDTGQHQSPEAAAVERARAYAEQRRAEARARFETPSWMGPERSHSAATPSIPRQPPPAHEALAPEPDVPAVPAGPPIPSQGHWVEGAGPRMLASLMLAVCLAGALVCLFLAVATESVQAVVGLVVCAFFAVLCRGAMMSAGLVTVDLKGSMLTVHHDGYLDTFDLAGPLQLVEQVGMPGRRGWQLRLETADGRVVELGGHQVDAVELHRIVEHYRAMATRERRARERRDNR
ncbi:MAG TPA: hypothetical protein VFO98_01910 [Marmoricola sp.]|jgi:hypothetical protein|nr:hypothetical protein [Marmoricola sp.]